MKDHPFSLLAVGLFAGVLVSSVVLVAADNQSPTRAATGWTPPRTADGEPDFQGYWRFSAYPDGTPGNDGAALDILAHRRTDDVNAHEAPTMVVDPAGGTIPYDPAAAARKKAYVAPGHVYAGAIDPHVRCWRNGPPRSVYAPNGLEILQIPGYVVILGEYSHNYRVIPTDGKPHLDKKISLFIGDSRGRWEGDTLVVDTTNLNGQFWLEAAGDITSPTLHLVERWTPIDADTISYEATLDDPSLYTRPWKIRLSLGRRTEPGYELIEFACHEGERSLQNILDVTPGAK